MSGERAPINGVVGRHEYEAHCEAAQRRDEQVAKRLDDHASRIDDLERKWDRYAGPITIVLVILTAAATITNLAVAWLG